ncbi:9148_t:CDS:2, partial [Acaulospora morrowiae]
MGDILCVAYVPPVQNTCPINHHVYFDKGNCGVKKIDHISFGWSVQIALCATGAFFSQALVATPRSNGSPPCRDRPRNVRHVKNRLMKSFGGDLKRTSWGLFLVAATWLHAIAVKLVGLDRDVDKKWSR